MVEWLTISVVFFVTIPLTFMKVELWIPVASLLGVALLMAYIR